MTDTSVPAFESGYDRLPSPNWDDRPNRNDVDCVVIHATVLNTVVIVAARFADPESKVSSHFLVDRDGVVSQFVPIEARAWHAGVSVLGGREKVNDFSVGIEIVNLNDGVDPFTAAQYEAVADIVRRVRLRYEIPGERIVSHAEIARPVGRKSDPVGFDFARLRDMLA